MTGRGGVGQREESPQVATLAGGMVAIAAGPSPRIRLRYDVVQVAERAFGTMRSKVRVLAESEFQNVSKPGG